MQHERTIDGYLAGIGVRIGVALALDDDRQCVLACEDDLDCTVAVPEGGDLVLFHAPLLPVPDQGRAALLEQALALNLYGEGTACCTLALDREQNQLVLCLARRVPELDSTTFANLLGGFIATARGLRARLGGPGEDAPASAGDDAILRNLHLRA